ncbi:hypothetical protein J437_LFUL009118 [Ladona fulva]|uniref:Potassium channel domain-containing protein n=1 Tax=Ladona fulva TaxID=123851 RepID=A0A8K0KCD7_LADFU|nr:hypothetical protein J437_LFUL009118 [Ladona fulva]
MTPRTVWGKVATMAYALAGIPLMLLYMASVGDILASAFRYVYFNFLCREKRSKRSAEEGEESRKDKQIPVWACLSVIAGFVAGGATLFSAWEGWPLLDAAYFCVVSLVTVGFGDLVPGDAFSGDTSNLSIAEVHSSSRIQSDAEAGDDHAPRSTPPPDHSAVFVFSDYVTTADMMMVDGKLIFCALYLLTGMALLAMNFHLMQETGLRAARRVLERLRPSWGEGKGQKAKGSVRRWERKGWRRSTWAGEGRRWREENCSAAPVVITLQSEEGAVYDWEPGGAAGSDIEVSTTGSLSRGEWRQRRASDGALTVGALNNRLELPRSLSRSTSAGREAAEGRRRKRDSGRLAAWRRRQLKPRQGFQNPFFSSVDNLPSLY